MQHLECTFPTEQRSDTFFEELLPHEALSLFIYVLFFHSSIHILSGTEIKRVLQLIAWVSWRTAATEQSNLNRITVNTRTTSLVDLKQ